MNFNFQGSQILSVRVPISQKASEVDFQFPARIIRFMMVTMLWYQTFWEFFLDSFTLAERPVGYVAP